MEVLTREKEILPKDTCYASLLYFVMEMYKITMFKTTIAYSPASSYFHYNFLKLAHLTKIQL